MIPDELVGDILRIKREFHAKIDSAVGGYLESGGSVTRWRNIARKAIVDDHPRAFYTGFVETGGEDAETEREDEQWLTDEMNAQLEFVDAMFAALKDLLGKVDADEEAARRADGYTDTLRAVYAEGKLRGAGNVMLTWRLGNTEVHCESGNGKMGCAQLDGKRYSSKKWIKLGYKPRNPGNDNITCGGWKCDCRWELDNGDEFTA